MSGDANSTVLGVLVLARHGDRQGFYQDPNTYAASATRITPLGNVRARPRACLLRPRSRSFLFLLYSFHHRHRRRHRRHRHCHRRRHRRRSRAQLTSITAETLEILSNREIIAINQDPVVGTGLTPFRWGRNVRPALPLTPRDERASERLAGWLTG